LPIWVIRRQIASAIHIVVQVSRLLGGARKVVKISEVTGMEGDNFVMHDLFAFKQTGVDDRQVAQGYFHATGIRPNCLERLQAFGAGLHPDLFERRILNPGL
jgi:pilus assembly protein CpaF